MARAPRPSAGAELMPTVPDAYVREIEFVVAMVRGWLEVRSDDPPRFQLPGKDVLVAAGVDQVPAVAVNASARRLLAVLIESCSKTFGEPPTITQLGVAFDIAGLRVERCRLADLGIAF